MPRNKTYLDLTGQRFGKLIVLRRAGSWRGPSGQTAPTWLTRCDCGTKKVIVGVSMRIGTTTSCGCLRQHGMLGTPEYAAWVNMIRRCTNPKVRSYRLYGARGISVCESWRKSFRAFFADVGRRPSRRHSLDRIDNNGNYEPGNVRWATHTQQMRNKRTSHVLTVRGVSATISEWAEKTGLGKSTIRERISRGWTAERSVSTPV